MSKLWFKAVSVLVGAVGSMVAGAVFTRAWHLLAAEDEPPEATQAERSWTRVLTAAALEGAISAVVKAALRRAGAVAVSRTTGSWPGATDAP